MNAKQYVRILKESLLTSLQDHDGDLSEIYFQQDNNPKHTSALAQTFFEENSIMIDLLPWAASSPDMNIIESAWEELDAHIRHRTPMLMNCEQLWEALQEEWANLNVRYIQHLYGSMPCCVQALKVAKGSHTKY